MPQGRPRYTYTSEEKCDILTFVLQEAHDPDTGEFEKRPVQPFRDGVFKQFVKQKMPHRSTESVKQHLRRSFLQGDHWDRFSLEEVAKLHYVMNVPLDDERLDQLRTVADVQVDQQYNIVSYTSKGEQGLKIESPLTAKAFGPRKVNLFSPEEDADLWRFAVERMHQSGDDGTKIHILCIRFWSEYLNENRDSVRTAKSLFCRMQNLKRKIHLTDFDNKTKVKLYQLLHVPVEETLLEELKKEAAVKVDMKGCIVEYVEKCQQEPKKQNKKGSEGSSETSNALCEFLLERNRDPDTHEIQKQCVDVSDLTIFEKFKAEFKCSDSAEELREHFVHDLTPNMHHSPFDIRKKALLYYSLEIPIWREYIPKMERVANIDESGYILELKEESMESQEDAILPEKTNDSTEAEGPSEEKRRRLSSHSDVNSKLNVSTHKFLKGLINLVMTVDSESLTEISETLEREMTESKEKDKMMSVETVRSLVSSSLELIR